MTDYRRGAGGPGGWLVLFFGLAVVVFALFGCAPAKAHSWYDGACCNDRDCAPVKPGVVVEDRDGWTVTLRAGDHPSLPAGSETRVYRVDRHSPKARLSKDERYHPCVTPYAKELLCLYVPSGSS